MNSDNNEYNNVDDNTDNNASIKFYKNTNHFAEIFQKILAIENKSTSTSYSDKEFTKDLFRIQRDFKKLKI